MVPTSMIDLFIFHNSPFSEDQHRLIVREGDTLRISCNPTGRPEPSVEWWRSDGTPIIQVLFPIILLANIYYMLNLLHERYNYKKLRHR